MYIGVLTGMFIYPLINKKESKNRIKMNNYKGIDLGFLPDENIESFNINVKTAIYDIDFDKNTIEFQGGDGAVDCSSLDEFVQYESPVNIGDSIYFQEPYCIGAWFLDNGANILFDLKDEEMYVIPLSDTSPKSPLREKINWNPSWRMEFEQCKRLTKKIKDIKLVKQNEADDSSYVFEIKCEKIINKYPKSDMQ